MSSAPDARHRGVAQILLARDLTRRFATSVWLVSGHAAFEDVRDTPETKLDAEGEPVAYLTTLQQFLDRGGLPSGGPRVTRRYFWPAPYAFAVRRMQTNVETEPPTIEPAPAPAPNPAWAPITPIFAELRSAVVAAMGAGSFAEAREVWSTALADRKAGTWPTLPS
jgi:hypothetical protein